MWLYLFFITYSWSSQSHHLKCLLGSPSQKRYRKINMKISLRKSTNNWSRIWKLRKNKIRQIKSKEDKPLITLSKKKERKQSYQNLISNFLQAPKLRRRWLLIKKSSTGLRKELNHLLKCSTKANIGLNLYKKVLKSFAY